MRGSAGQQISPSCLDGAEGIGAMTEKEATMKSTLTSRRRGGRRTITLVLAACSLATSLALGATAGASAPNANVDKSTFDLFAASCDGQDVETLSPPGATFWIGDQKYIFVSATVTSGGEVVFAKEWGARTALGERIGCEGDFPEGAHFELIVAAVPPAS
jgi:hypothetical protein